MPTIVANTRATPIANRYFLPSFHCSRHRPRFQFARSKIGPSGRRLLPRFPLPLSPTVSAKVGGHNLDTILPTGKFQPVMWVPEPWEIRGAALPGHTSLSRLKIIAWSRVLPCKKFGGSGGQTPPNTCRVQGNRVFPGPQSILLKRLNLAFALCSEPRIPQTRVCGC